MLTLTLNKGESVTLELPDGRTCEMIFMSKPRSNVVRFGFNCPDDIEIKRGEPAEVTGEGSHDDGQSEDAQ